jgi:dienelactone hydrolase
MDVLREQIASFLGVCTEAHTPALQILSYIEEDGFRRELVQFVCRDGELIRAFLFLPNGNARGAVLVLHQHNGQWEIGKSEIAGVVGDPLQAFGPILARRGVVVLAPDAVGFESRMRQAHGAGVELAPGLQRPYSTANGWLQFYNQMAHRLVAGDLLMRKLLHDFADALSALHVHSNVSRVGVIGHSFGGTAALFLAALDTRISFACTSGAVCSLQNKLASGTGLDMPLIIPGFLQRFDIADVLRCVAPRKVFVVSSDADPYSADATEVVLDAQSAFQHCHCKDHLRHLRVPGPHALDRQRFDAIVEWVITEAGRIDELSH